MSVYEHLYQWQKDIVNSIVTEKPDAYGLFLDCGLGKTPLGLALAEVSNSNKIIIITINFKSLEPESKRGSWLWWSKQLNNSPYQILNKTSLSKSKTVLSSSSNSLLIINFEGLWDRKLGNLKKYIDKYIESCRDQNVTILVDESHKMKDNTSQQSKALFQLQKKLKLVANQVHSYLLTGTPFTQGFIDIWAQLKFLGCPMTKGDFTDNFCVRGNIRGLLGWQQPIVGYKNVEELYKLIHQYAITIKSTDVVKLPPQIFEYHVTDESPIFETLCRPTLHNDEILMWDKLRQSAGMLGLPYPPISNKGVSPNPWYFNMDYPNLNYYADTTGTKWLRTRQLSIGFQGSKTKFNWYNVDRLNQLREFLEHNENNYILFYNFDPEFYEIYQICTELGYNIDIVNGSIKSQYFYDKYENQNPEERLVNTKNIILANFASGSTGGNWQAYNQCILFSIPLYSEYTQGLKRIHRIGQDQTTIYHIFTNTSWIDKDMLKALDLKTEYSNDMFNIKLNNIITEYK